MTTTEIFAKSTTADLIAAVRMLEKSTTPAERLSRAWISDELERRAGGISIDQELRFEELYDQTDNYLDALLLMFPGLTA